MKHKPRSANTPATRRDERGPRGLADRQGGRGRVRGHYSTHHRLPGRGVDSVRELRKIGREISHLNVLWTGDSVEGCVGHYPSQTFAVELDRRDQVKVTRRLLTDSLQEWSRHFATVTVAAVAGNHGENRNGGGKAFTGVAR
jgi:hypothetical protein